MTAKKRIVAMVLALSVFSSTFGMIGAAAADAESLETPEKPAFTVTVVSAGADEAGANSAPPEADAPAASVKEDGEPAQGTTDSESTGSEGSDSESSSSDVTTIQRPEQSETVETLPGTAKDNKDHIKADADKKDEQPAGSETQPETPAESESTGKDTDKAEQPASSPASSDTTEEKPEEKPAENLDYTLAYDPETGHFKVTFNIKADAEGDQTIELSRVQEVVQQYGEEEADKWLATPEGQKWYNRNEGWIGVDKVQTNLQLTNNVLYSISYTRDENGNIQRKVTLVPQPGDTVTFDVALTNGSKHTYVYKDGSLTVATAQLPKNDDPNASVGFDGQPLPGVISDTDVVITYNRGKDVHGCMEDLIDKLGLDRQWDSISTVHRAVDKYIKDNYNGDYDAYILDYYNKKDGTNYTSVSDLLANNEAALTDLNKSGTGAELHRITFDSPTYYNHFYKNVLSLKVDDPEKLEEFKKDAGVSWNTKGNELTIGDYMYDKLNSTEGAWDKANSYFNTLLSAGLNEDEATWAAFALAVNLDGNLANNNMQDKPLSWYASMVLHQTDGTLDLTKVDSKTGETIGDNDGEGQSSFYLWKYETDETSGEESTLYYTKVPDKVDDNGNVISAGYYGWVKYDPDNKSMSYTITTTNGKLNIDYAMLEDVVYYLQEAVAPDGYDVDTTVYVICDEDTYQELKESGKTIVNVAAGTTSSAADLEHLGAIEGGKTLTVKFLNSKTVPPVVIPDPDEPDPTVPETPTPDEPTVPEEVPQPEVPETPVEPAQPAAPEVAPGTPVLPKTGTTDWLVAVLMSAGFAFTAAGVFFSRKQYASKH